MSYILHVLMYCHSSNLDIFNQSEEIVSYYKILHLGLHGLIAGLQLELLQKHAVFHEYLLLATNH